ncbi:MAG TPA: response regulator [Pyrinomonadaceae bacterium]|nr:response regulator [Pyrinomonadaceae bacterium]
MRRSSPTHAPHTRLDAPAAPPAAGPRRGLDATPDLGLEADKPAPKRRALVVDDAPDVTELLAMVLRYAGYDVVAVFSAPDALETARAEQFDVIVSDIGMPGMNGYELAAALRGLPEYASVPLIAVTGFAMYDDRDRALASGFNAFLTKPINPSDLVELVGRV